jgi:hypothetical protein
VVLSCCLRTVLQATVGNGLSFGPRSFGKDRRAAPAVVSMVVVVDGSCNLRSEIAVKEAIFQRDTVLRVRCGCRQGF